VAAVVLHALQPRGCVGDECLVRPEREATTATAALVVVVGVALLAFAVALVVVLWRTETLGWIGTLGVVACALGLLLLALAGVSPLRDDIRPLPFLVAVVAGLALIGWALLRSGVVPRGAVIGLLVSLVPLAAYTEQNSRVLLALPFGVVWLATGVALVQRSRSERQSTPTDSSVVPGQE
jgi:hypothetical protein